MNKSTSTNTMPLHQGSEVILINADSSYLDLSNEIDRRVTQSSGVLHILCGIDLGNVAGELADNCISAAAWGVLEQLEEISTLADMLCELAKQKAPRNVKSITQSGSSNETKLVLKEALAEMRGATVLIDTHLKDLMEASS